MDTARIFERSDGLCRRKSNCLKAGVICWRLRRVITTIRPGRRCLPRCRRFEGNARGGNAAAAVVLRAERSGQGANSAAGAVQQKAALWSALLSGGMTMAALKQVNAQAAKLIEDWAEQGWIETAEAAKPVLRSSEFQLNANQQKASDEIQTTFGSFQPFLLYGITGSGKTEVYFDAMAKVLAAGAAGVVSVARINLTPQLLKRVETGCRRTDRRVAQPDGGRQAHAGLSARDVGAGEAGDWHAAGGVHAFA